MARSPRRSSRAQPSPTLGERVVAIEAYTASALNELKAEMRLAISQAIGDALKDVASNTLVQQLQGQVAALQGEVSQLQAARNYGAGAAGVEQQVRSNAQEWARTLTPLVWAGVVGFVAIVFGLKAIPG